VLRGSNLLGWPLLLGGFYLGGFFFEGVFCLFFFFFFSFFFLPCQRSTLLFLLRLGRDSSFYGEAFPSPPLSGRGGQPPLSFPLSAVAIARPFSFLGRHKRAVTAGRHPSFSFFPIEKSGGHVLRLSSLHSPGKEVRSFPPSARSHSLYPIAFSFRRAKGSRLLLSLRRKPERLESPTLSSSPMVR